MPSSQPQVELLHIDVWYGNEMEKKRRLGFFCWSNWYTTFLERKGSLLKPAPMVGTQLCRMNHFWGAVSSGRSCNKNQHRQAKHTLVCANVAVSYHS